MEDGKIIGEQVISSDGNGHCALAGLLQAAKADALICGGIGMGAQAAMADAGIRLYAGVHGSADAAAKALAEGTLEYDPNARCDHHHEHHEGECGHHHESKHQFGDEGCKRSRREGECRRDKGECGHGDCQKD